MGIVGLIVASLALVSCSSAKHSPKTAPAPKYTLAQQEAFYGDLVKDDGTVISPYVSKYGQTGLNSLLALGSGFCRFLADGTSAATALSDLQSQGQNLTDRTGFSGSQNDYESIGADAILGLCPSEESALTPAEQAQLNQIKQSISGS